MFDKVMSFLKELNSTTLMILVFAAILVIFLLILIIVTIKVLKSGNDSDDKDDSSDYEDGDEETEVLAKKRKKRDTEKLSKPAPESDEDEDEDEDEESDDDEDDDDEYEDDEEEDEDDKVSSFKSGFSSSARDTSTDEALKVAEQINNEVAATMSAKLSEAFASTKAAQAEAAEAPAADTPVSAEPAAPAPQETVQEAENDDSDKVDEKTNELDTTAIKRALREAKDQVSSQKAASEAESANYNAKMDSAFIDGESAPTGNTIIAKPIKEGFVLSDEDIENATETALAEHNKVVSGTDDKITVNPVNAVNINTVNTVDRVDTKSQDAGIESMEQMEEFLTENPVPKKKKKKVKKKDQAFEDKFEDDSEDIRTGEYFWYNSQDIDGLKRKEDMYYYCHYFNNPSRAVIPLVTEMYDCAFVRTEEIQKIAYGISFRSMKMREILSSEEVIGFDRSKATKEPSEKDLAEIYRKWCGYVDNFLTIIVINAPDDVKDYLKKALYDYGKSNDIETLLYSPE